MKRIISMILLAVLALSVVACGTPANPETPATVKFGAAVVAVGASGTNATETKSGTLTVDYNVAAVLVDNDGKIVACELDAIQNKVSYTAAGEIVPVSEFKTKHEQGDAYGMANYGADLNNDGVILEWYKQADILVAAVIGKTITEVKAMVAETGYGPADLQTAGCTIAIDGYVAAIEAAVNNATTEVAANATISLGIISSLTKSVNATEEKNGTIGLESDVVAMAMVDGKNAATYTNTLVVEASVTNAGAFGAVTKSQDKRALGDAYGMASFGTDLNDDGVILEWYKQVEALEALYVGKTVTEIAALALESGYGVEDVVNADCTIYIAGYISAAVKAASN